MRVKAIYFISLDLLARPSYDLPMSKASDAARYLSSLGASKGGKARAAKLTPKRRKEIAQKAAKTRWGKKPEGSV
jgi:hypothetical protein